MEWVETQHLGHPFRLRPIHSLLYDLEILPGLEKSGTDVVCFCHKAFPVCRALWMRLPVLSR